MKKYLNKHQYPTPYPRHARDLIKMIVDKEAEMMSPSVITPIPTNMARHIPTNMARHIPTNMARHIPTKCFTGVWGFVNYQIGRILP